MSRSRRALFFIGILIIVTLALIGSYFALIVLGGLDDGANASPTKITYSFDIKTKEYEGELYGSCKVTKSASLKDGHYDEITFTFDESTTTYKPVIVIKDAEGIDVSNKYKISISRKQVQADSIPIKVQPRNSLEFNGVSADSYSDTALLRDGYYLLGDCYLNAELDVSSYLSQIQVGTLNVNVVDGNNNVLDFFNLDINSYTTSFIDRCVKIKVFYNPYNGVAHYEIVEGSFIYGHTLKLKYHGYEDYCEINVLDSNKNDITYYYNVIVTEYN